MLDKFQFVAFSSCNLNDPFFISLKEDYPLFTDWFNKKAAESKNAFVYKTPDGNIQAFLYMKSENEPLELQDGALPAEPRLKIGTLKINDTIKGLRLGEGVIGYALWRWRRNPANQIYVTVFEKHQPLIMLLTKYGFKYIGRNKNNENVYVKDKRAFDTTSPYTLFPYILGNFKYAGYIPINDDFHDALFPYSELYNTVQDTVEIAAANGITKVFIATPYRHIEYAVGEPVFIFRKYTGENNRQYKSCLTSYCTIVSQECIKMNNRAIISFDEFLKRVGNKSVYDKLTLFDIYNNSKNVIILTMVYNGFFGKGHNVIYKTLKDKGLFNAHPYEVHLSREQFEQILEMSDTNVQNVIVD